MKYTVEFDLSDENQKIVDFYATKLKITQEEVIFQIFNGTCQYLRVAPLVFISIEMMEQLVAYHEKRHKDDSNVKLDTTDSGIIIVPPKHTGVNR